MDKDQIWSYFHKIIHQKRLSNVYLFLGSPGVGKLTIALRLIKVLLCSGKIEKTKFCGKCSDCRLCDKIIHPRFIHLQGIDSIKIETVRAILQQSRRMTSELPHFLVINDAERLTIQAANALLCFLEEPNTDWYIILLSGYAVELIPTLRSRCQKIYFSSLSRAERIEYFLQKGFLSEQANILFHISISSADVCLNWTNEQFASRFKRVIQWSESLFSSRNASLHAVKLLWNDGREDAMFNLDLCILWVRERLRQKLGLECFMDLADYRKYAVTDISLPKIFLFIEYLLKTRQKLHNKSLSPQSLLERLVLDVATTLKSV